MTEFERLLDDLVSRVAKRARGDGGGGDGWLTGELLEVEARAKLLRRFEVAEELCRAVALEFSRGETEKPSKEFDFAFLAYLKANPTLAAEVRQLNRERKMKH